MLDAAKRAATGRESLDDLEARLHARAKSSFIAAPDIRKALVAGWEAAVEHLLDDGALDLQEENALVAFKERFSLPQDELDARGALTRLVKAAILRDLFEGRIPQRVQVTGGLPFNFQKNEQLVYLFTDVDYLEDRTRTHYVGGYHGVSMRVMRGVYYRVGGFRGNPVSRTERIHIDTGSLAVTTRHIYFSGSSKSFRVRHDKIVSFMSFSDGIGLVRDAATAKPQIFITGDGWFTYNLLTNVSRSLAGV